MEHLRAEIRELRRLPEREVGDDPRRFDDARIGGEHAVDVRPDLNLARINRGADNGRGVVRPAAPQRGGDPLRRGAHEAADHGDAAFSHARGHFACNRGARLVGQRRGGRMRTVRDNRAAGVHP
jgi:hypothetical protein